MTRCFLCNPPRKGLRNDEINPNFWDSHMRAREPCCANGRFEARNAIRVFIVRRVAAWRKRKLQCEPAKPRELTPLDISDASDGLFNARLHLTDGQYKTLYDALLIRKLAADCSSTARPATGTC